MLLLDIIYIDDCDNFAASACVTFSHKGVRKNEDLIGRAVGSDR